MGQSDLYRVSLGWDIIDPADDVPYTIDYSQVVPATDTITSSTWSIQLISGGGSVTLTTHNPVIVTPLTLRQVQVSVAGNSGATVPQDYIITNVIVTAGGVHVSRTFGVSVRFK